MKPLLTGFSEKMTLCCLAEGEMPEEYIEPIPIEPTEVRHVHIPNLSFFVIS